MSEYLSKKAVLEWLTEQYFHGMGEEAWNTAISKLQEKIESDVFDAPEMEHINAYWAREGLIKHQEAEVQRLRAALELCRHALKNGYFQDELILRNALKAIDQALSTTSEQAERVREHDWVSTPVDANDLIGDLIGERCPKCDADMLGNKVGDKWCSLVGCDYSINALGGDENDV